MKKEKRNLEIFKMRKQFRIQKNGGIRHITCEEISKKFNLTRERIKQICDKLELIQRHW